VATAAKSFPSPRVVRSDSRLVEQFTAARPSVADRMATGKALRTKVPRASLAEYKPSSKRKDPVAILEAQAKSRLPQLIPVRYARMLASSFAFLRGCAAIMAQDLSPSPVTGFQYRSAATCTCPILVSLPQPNATLCLASMISMKQSPDPGSGT